jgi:hypothetical protein
MCAKSLVDRWETEVARLSIGFGARFGKRYDSGSGHRTPMLKEG